MKPNSSISNSKTPFLKRAAIGIALAVPVLILLQAAIAYYVSGDKDLYLPPVSEYRKIMAAGPDILFVGDSTLLHWALPDKSRKTIPAMLAERFPDRTVGVIAHPGYHLGVFRAIAWHLARHRFPIKTVIIPVSLRSFCVEWDRHPLNQFPREINYLTSSSWFQRAFYRPLAIFKYINEDPINDQTYRQTKVFSAGKLIGVADNFDNRWLYSTVTDQHMRDKIQFRYMCTITEDHPKIRQLLDIADLLKGAGIEPVFYAVPMDTDYMESVMGPIVVGQIRENADLVKRLLVEKGTPLLDLSESVRSSGFDWKKEKYPNEHLNEKGRELLISALADRLYSSTSSASKF